MPKTTSTERMRRMRRLNKEDPDRKHRSLDSLFMFGCVDVAVIVDKNGGIWFKGVDLARALEFEDPHHAIYDTIDGKHLQSYEQISCADVSYRHIPNIHPKTTFVNEMGMNLFVLRSRMPKAEAFAEWVCGEVLPSIRKSGRYEIDSDNNPYREMNEYLKKEMERLKLENEEIKTENKEIKTENKEIKTENKEIKTENKEIKTEMKEIKGENQEIKHKNGELISAIIKANVQLFGMRPTCIAPMTSDEKEEYFVVYRKFAIEKLKEIEDTEILHFPYYACRVQLDSLDDRRQDLRTTYTDLSELLRLKVPNSVNFFNYVVSELSDVIERGRKGRVQSFRIVGQSEGNFAEQERKMLTMLRNLHRSRYGSVEEGEDEKKINVKIDM